MTKTQQRIIDLMKNNGYLLLQDVDLNSDNKTDKWYLYDKSKELRLFEPKVGHKTGKFIKSSGLVRPCGHMKGGFYFYELRNLTTIQTK